MVIVFIISWLFFIYIITEYLSLKKQTTFIVYIVTLVFFYGLNTLVNYTTDAEGYQTLIDLNVKKDYTYNLIKDFSVSNFGVNYFYLHNIYFVFITLFYIIFIYLYTQNIKKINVFFLTVLYLVVSYFFIVNQIRYFLGYYLFLIAIYLYYQKKFKISFLFIILSLLCHSGLILYIPILFLLRINIKYINMKNAIVLTTLSSITFFIFNIYLIPILENLGFFSTYIEDKAGYSSILGGVYFYLPNIIILYYLLSKIKINYTRFSEKSIFLFRVYLLNYIYLGIALSIQIIGHRTLFPSYIVFLIFLKSIGINNYKLLLITLIYGLYIYGLPFLILGSSFWYEQVLKILTSINF